MSTDRKLLTKARVYLDGVAVLAETIGPDGETILWALTPGETGGVYRFPEHEDPRIPIGATAVGERLDGLSLPLPGRCNATRSDGGHCRMPEGRCRFHDSEMTLF